MIDGLTMAQDDGLGGWEVGRLGDFIRVSL